MKIATWNVNSLKVRLPQVIDWLQTQTPDVLCLQELKMENAAFPEQTLRDAGYHAYFNGQKTYNGVAILSRLPVTDVHHDIPGYDDPQKRIIAATIDGIRVICAYFPNGQAVGSDKFAYKLQWLAALTGWIRQCLTESLPLVLTGDFNIAPANEDVSPQWTENSILVSPQERQAFQDLIDSGLIDAFRLFPQEAGSFSWWDYRMGAFRRNFGLRIDHILVSHGLQARCAACHIDKTPRGLERPSDHAPVILTLSG